MHFSNANFNIDRDPEARTPCLDAAHPLPLVLTDAGGTGGLNS